MADESNEAGTNTGEILTELGSEVRRAILFKLNEKALKVSELARELNITIQHVHNNINRLVDGDFVEKYSEGYLHLTCYCKNIMKQLSSFHFLEQHKDYFRDHTFGNLPVKFEHRIGELNNCSVVTGVVAVLQQWKLMYQEAEECINSIIPQVPVDLIEPLAEKIKSGVKFMYILPEDTIVPSGTAEATEKVSWRSLLSEGRAERRMVSRVMVSTIVTDRSSCVLFPNLKDQTDMNVTFYSEDKIFHDWCQDYFMYIWQSSDLFDRSKLEERL